MSAPPDLGEARSEPPQPSPSHAPKLRAVHSVPVDHRGSDTKSKPFDLVYLASCPLIQRAYNGVTPIEALDLRSEQKNFITTIGKSSKRFRFKRDYATIRRLGTNLVLGCRVLHYTGHGLENGLAFEDECGVMHIVQTQTLRELMAAGAKEEEVKLVFVAACHSESAGKAFVEAGVKHVIAVKISEKVADTGARHFMNSFYLALLMGRTVANAFKMARETLKAIPDLPTADDEAKKYLLLPKEADHNVQIFPDLPTGMVEDCTDKRAVENLPASVDHFTGRNFEVQQIVEYFVKDRKRLVTICGESGIGKTAVAIYTARFLLERGLFKDGVIFFRFQGKGDFDVGQIAEMIAEGLGLDIPTHGLIRALKSKIRKKERGVLLVMDGLDEFVSLQEKDRKQFTVFISELLQDCRDLRILATATTPIGISRGVEEVEFPLKGMSVYDICNLFNKLTNDKVTAEVVGIKDAYFATRNDIFQGLAQHKLIKEIVNGHPYRCWMAARRFNKHPKLDQVAKIMSYELRALEEQQLEEEQSRAAKNSRRRKGYQHPSSQHTSSSSSNEQHSPSSNDLKMVVGGGRNNSTSTSRNNVDDVYAPVGPGEFAASGRGGHKSSSSSSSSSTIVTREELDYENKIRTILSQEARVFWDSFKPRMETSWESFKRRLNSHFKAYTGVTRGLDEHDIHSASQFVQKFARRKNIQISHKGLSVSAFNVWWEMWYTPLVKTIQRISKIWDNNYIKGVAYDKNSVRNSIVGGPVGTFMLRLSGNNPGCIVLGFVGSDRPKKILHILIDGRHSDFKIKFDDGKSQSYARLEDLVLQCKRVTILHPNVAKHAAFGNLMINDDHQSRSSSGQYDFACDDEGPS